LITLIWVVGSRYRGEGHDRHPKKEDMSVAEIRNKKKCET